MGGYKANGPQILLKLSSLYTLFSYAFVLLNDLFTAGNGIIIKQKLDTKDLGKNGLLFYNCLFMIPPAITVFFMTEDLPRIIGEHFTVKK